jgi:hypothetical protein
METLRKVDISDYAGVSFSSSVGPAPLLQWIAIEDLRIDDRYQRPVNVGGRKQVRSIANRFRWSRFAPIIVAPIEGGLFAVIDGQHRAHAARLRSIKSVPCMVVTVDTAEQAEAFVEINTRQIAVKPATIHRSRLISGEAEALEVQAICDEAGVILISSNRSAKLMGRGETLAVQVIYKARKDFGRPTLTAALEAIVKAGAGNPGLLRGPVITAYCAVFAENEALRDHDGLLDALDEFDLPAAHQRMQDAVLPAGQPRWRPLAAALLTYLRKALPGAKAAA